MATAVAPVSTLLSPHEEAALSERLGRWRRQPLSLEELSELLPRVCDPSLALSLAERLGMAGPEAISWILPLCQSQGITKPLIRALGICHHPQACEQLLSWLPNAGELEPEVLEALGCWGNLIDFEIIEAALHAPGQSHRLAGLTLLTFRNRSLDASAMLRLTAPLLQDFRAEIVIATLKLLQRRNEATVLEAIRHCISLDALPGVAETALQALGCIGSLESCRHLIALRSQLAGTRLEEALERQLKAQIRHRAWIEPTLGS